MKRATTLNDILGDFTPTLPETASLKGGGCVAIWLTAELKARYDQLQKQSGKQFSKKMREAVTALIELAEARAV